MHTRHLTYIIVNGFVCAHARVALNLDCIRKEIIFVAMNARNKNYSSDVCDMWLNVNVQ